MGLNVFHNFVIVKGASAVDRKVAGSNPAPYETA